MTRALQSILSCRGFRADRHPPPSCGASHSRKGTTLSSEDQKRYVLKSQDVYQWSQTSWASQCICGFVCLWHPTCGCSIGCGKDTSIFIFKNLKQRPSYLLFVWTETALCLAWVSDATWVAGMSMDLFSCLCLSDPVSWARVWDRGHYRLVHFTHRVTPSSFCLPS